MSNGAPRSPGALKALRAGDDRQTRSQAFDADQRRAERENTPATIGGVSFKRRRKDWQASRIMRSLMREQESALALSTRLRARIAELEVDQVECAAKGESTREADLEAQIRELVHKGDEATEDAELVTYRLLALLLVPPAPAEGEDALDGFGPVEDEQDAWPAIAFLQTELDVEDAADLARELTGSTEPDPQQTPSSETGSS